MLKQNLLPNLRHKKIQMLNLIQSQKIHKREDFQLCPPRCKRRARDRVSESKATYPSLFFNLKHLQKRCQLAHSSFLKLGVYSR